MQKRSRLLQMTAHTHSASKNKIIYKTNIDFLKYNQ